MPGGIPSPIARPEATVKAGEWNTIEVVLDANIVRAFLNDAAGIRDGVADAEFGAFGAIGLYAGGDGEVRLWANAGRVGVQVEESGAGFDVAAVEQDLMNMGLKIDNVVDEDVRRVVEMHGLAKLNISLADRFCLALAQRLGLPTLTGDRAWARLELPIEVRLFR